MVRAEFDEDSSDKERSWKKDLDTPPLDQPEYSQPEKRLFGSSSTIVV
jgi:hypothetical protein